MAKRNPTEIEMKTEVSLAYEAYKDERADKEQKIPPKIKQMRKDIMFATDTEEIKRLYNKFFGHLNKSVRAKRKFE